MSTNGLIGFWTDSSEQAYIGAYHHWDSYPTQLGKTLWDAYHGYFQQNIPAMEKYLTRDHSAWSTINECDFSLPAGFYDLHKRPEIHGPICYCHGDRHEENDLLTEMDNGLQWAYIFNQQEKTMTILGKSWDQPVRKVTIIDLQGQEPDWEIIEREN